MPASPGTTRAYTVHEHSLRVFFGVNPWIEIILGEPLFLPGNG